MTCLSVPGQVRASVSQCAASLGRGIAEGLCIDGRRRATNEAAETLSSRPSAQTRGLSALSYVGCRPLRTQSPAAIRRGGRRARLQRHETKTVGLFLAFFALLSCSHGRGGVTSAPTGELYPAPRRATLGALRHIGRGCLDQTPLAAEGAVAATFATLLARHHVPAADADSSCDWHVTVNLDATVLDEEGYVLDTAAAAGGIIRTTISARTAAGAHFALEALGPTLGQGDATGASILTAHIDAMPGFRLRGFVEGFYGRPYNSDERRRILSAMATVGMNRYLYGPKDDRFTHVDWRKPYPAADAQAIREAAALATAAGIEFTWAASPGRVPRDVDALPQYRDAPPENSISYADDADFQVLLAKYDAVQGLGVRSFALFLDDIDENFYWPADTARFATLADAHAHLVQRLAAALSAKDPNARLLIVGMVYTNLRGDWEPYNKILRKDLPSNVDVLWTGPNVTSASLNAASVAGIDNTLGRNVAIWDNWPLSTESYAGRDADLSTAIQGVLVNSVLTEQGKPVDETLKVLGPIGDFLWNPEAYEPAASWERWRRARATAR